MTEVELSLARLTDTVRRGHELNSEIAALTKFKRGTDEGIMRASLKKEQRFLMRESRRLVSALIVDDASRKRVAEAVSEGVIIAKSLMTDDDSKMKLPTVKVA